MGSEEKPLLKPRRGENALVEVGADELGMEEVVKWGELEEDGFEEFGGVEDAVLRGGHGIMYCFVFCTLCGEIGRVEKSSLWCNDDKFSTWFIQVRLEF